jgi:hypothetical protein
LKIAITSTVFLHIYLVKILLAYTTNGHFLCSAEFWIMSIYLPFGIALFQANVTQLRSIAEQQEALLLRQSSYNGSKLATSGVQSVCTTHSSTEKLLLYCGRHGDTGTLTAVLDQQGTEYTLTHLQLIITSVIYVTSPTLQGNWSSYGDIPYNKGQVKCRKTLEWIPSAFWQLFWTWIYGPYELFRIRNIRDAHRFFASSLGMYLRIFYLLTFQADSADFRAHPSGSPPSSPLTLSQSTHGLSLPCGSPPAS